MSLHPSPASGPANPLSSEQRRALLELARRTIAAAVNEQPAPEPPPSFSSIRGVGAFVSLYIHERLRGCVGQVEPPTSLGVTIVRCAVGAAIEDSRFSPVRPEEVPDLEIEISLLSPLRSVRPEEVKVGVHGLLIRRGYFTGLLLPQVATKFQWSRERFLEETCYKAGLEPDAWKDSATRIDAFTAEVFSEAEFRAGGEARTA